MDNVICELKNISKRYQQNTVLNNINMSLYHGKIYGFIGKNGAGKTTTMRIIAGLSFPTSGDVYLYGTNDKNALQTKRKNIGCIIESPALYMGMSAKNNLKALQKLYGIADKNKINEILEFVGLSNAGNKAVKYFSLGMKQRLGIGMALINSPDFLILDEPINGLDPNGIVEIRKLIKKINTEQKVTILISSHILSELYQTVDYYFLIDKGQIIEEMTQKELEKKCQRYILIKSENVNIIKKVLYEVLHTENYILTDDGAVRIYDYTDDLIQIISVFEKVGISASNISVTEDSLEEYFLKKIKTGA